MYQRISVNSVDVKGRMSIMIEEDNTMNVTSLSLRYNLSCEGIILASAHAN